MPRFSVIIPTFNRAALVSEAVASVRAQTITDYELIVVDDGSTDSTADALSAIPNLRLIRQPNAGPGPARNTGLAAASGEYTAFLDADDRWPPWTLDTFARAIDGSSRAAAALICGSPRAFTADSEIAAITREPDLFERHPDYLGTDPIDLFPGAGVLCARTDALRRVGGFLPNRMTAEDADLYLRLGVEPGFVVVRRPFTLAYRIHEGAASLDGTLDEAGAHALLRRERAGVYPGGAKRRWQRERIITSHCRSRIMVAVRAGRLAAAARIYAHSLLPNARQRRFKFLFALPFLAALRLFGFGSGPLHTGVVRPRNLQPPHTPAAA